MHDLKPRVLYIHYYDHALNFVTDNKLKQSKLMQDTPEITYEITKLITLHNEIESFRG